MALSNKIFYDKHNILRIKAFEARIDKSKALSRTRELKFNQSSLFSYTTVSPYFVNNNTKKQQKPLICSLLKHEAEAYRYNLKQSITTITQSQQTKNKTPDLNLTTDYNNNNINKSHKVIAKLQLFISSSSAYQPLTTGLPRQATLPSTQQLVSRSEQTRLREKSESSQVSLRSLSLKEKLDRNVLRTNRASMTHSCKQYPRLMPTRSVLDKYAHLFGLQKDLLSSIKV